MAARLRLAPGVTLTRLPFGGVVLTNGVSFAVAELGEAEAARLDGMLSAAGHLAGTDDGAEPLIAEGWLVSVEDT